MTIIKSSLFLIAVAILIILPAIIEQLPEPVIEIAAALSLLLFLAALIGSIFAAITFSLKRFKTRKRNGRGPRPTQAAGSRTKEGVIS